MKKLLICTLFVFSGLSHALSPAGEKTSKEVLAAMEAFKSMDGQNEEQVQYLGEVLLPLGEKEQNRLCPNLLERVFGRKIDEHRALCKQAKKNVLGFKLLQEVIKEKIRFNKELERCGRDKACQKRARDEYALVDAGFQKKLSELYSSTK